MSNHIGIDLGTTNSVVAYVDEYGRPQVIPDITDNERLTPSAVCFNPEGIPLIGHPAKRMIGMGIPVFERFKRLMEDNLAVESNKDETKPSNLSSLVLKKMLEIAQDSLGEVGTAVVTIPAVFGNQSRINTRIAAGNAGLMTGHAINEPTAAALYYKYENMISDGIYYVYDYGGGTFDVSCIEVEGNHVNVLTSEGDPENGGSDFDMAIKALVIENYEKVSSEEFSELHNTHIRYEDIKKTLTNSTQTIVSVNKASGGIPAIVTVQRSDFENRISGLLAKTEIWCQSILARYPDFVDILLVGGNTRVPAVKESIEKIFGKPPITVGNPDESVALGAAVYTGIITGDLKENDNEIEVNEVANHCYGVVMSNTDNDGNITNDFVETIIKKDEPIPCEKTGFGKMLGNHSVLIQVTQSIHEETDPEDVSIRYEGTLHLDPDKAQKGDNIVFKYSYDVGEIIHCTITHEKSGKSVEVQLTQEE